MAKSQACRPYIRPAVAPVVQAVKGTRCRATPPCTTALTVHPCRFTPCCRVCELRRAASRGGGGPRARPPAAQRPRGARRPLHSHQDGTMRRSGAAAGLQRPQGRRWPASRDARAHPSHPPAPPPRSPGGRCRRFGTLVRRSARRRSARFNRLPPPPAAACCRPARPPPPAQCRPAWLPLGNVSALSQLNAFKIRQPGATTKQACRCCIPMQPQRRAESAGQCRSRHCARARGLVPAASV